MTTSAFHPSLLLADAVRQWMFRPSRGATYSAGTDAMFMFLFWFSTAVFIGLMVPMVWWTIKYRWKPGQRLLYSKSHNTALEITWTVIPTIIVVFMFLAGFWTYARQQIAPSNAVVLSLSAKKWSWDLSYPGGISATETTRNGAVDIPVFLVPEDTPIQLQMISEDVIHSFWVPDFRFKQDVFPNRFTTFWFQTEKLTPSDHDNTDLPYPNREHWVFCAEYCGDNHSEMAAIIRVVPREAFDSWMRAPWPEGMKPEEIGFRLWSLKGCNACHTLDGSPGTGPTWKNMAGYEHDYTDGVRRMADANHMRNAILNPGSEIRTGYTNQMPTYAGTLTNQDLNNLIAYMNTLSDRGARTGFDDPSSDNGDDQ
ncbi:MAG: cytochrome c oxidase subunit II [Phycisphaeraceae bacterium]|nr:cytochrome c oxidase subunit II [Phycisphaeraceae bacterium]MCW5755218.1 cytochrome c oxidase subunit II [Phycisphaeraceae bacterium]